MNLVMYQTMNSLTANLSRDRILTVMLLISLLAFALRVHRLDDKNIWWDEGSSAWQATQDLATITLYQARDQHPPLYYWALHLWSRATGHTTFALRLLSAMFGTLCIPVTYVLGRSLAGQQVGLLGALFVALARFHLWWSQEIKMYALVSFLSMLSTYLVVVILRQAGVLAETRRGEASRRADSFPSETSIRLASPLPPVLWVAYVVVTTLALYAHYLALPIVISQNLFLLIVLVARVKRRELRRALFVRWSLSQLTLVALFASWFLLHRQQSASWSSAPALTPSFVLRLVATLLSLGRSTHLERYTWVVLALWLPLLMALIPLLKLKERRWGGLLLWLCLLAPPALIYLLSLPRQGFLYEAKIAPRFFLVSLIPYSILLAWSLVLVGRRFVWAGLLGVTLVVVSSTAFLGDYYASRYLRDDYETLARTIHAYAQPGEAILLDTDAEWPVFEYYYTGSLPRHDIPAGEDITPESARSRLEPIWDQHDGLWVVFTSDTLVRDPRHFVEAWLDQHGQAVFDQRFADRRLVFYARTRRPLTVVDWDGFAIQHPLAEQVNNGMSLVGYDQALHEVRTGDTLRLVTYWRLQHVDPSPPARSVQALLLDESGQPVARADPSSSADAAWQNNNEDQTLRAQHDLDISSSVPAGMYDVCLRISRESDDSDATEMCISTVRVVHTAMSLPAEIEAIQHPVSQNLENVIRFLGYDLAAGPYRPGQAVKLTLYWQAVQKMNTDYIVFVHLLGSEFNSETGNFLWGQVDRVPVDGTYPTTAWAVGETIADAYGMPIQPDAPPGRYHIEIGVYEPITGQRLAVLDERGQPVEDRILLQAVEVLR